MDTRPIFHYACGSRHYFKSRQEVPIDSLKLPVRTALVILLWTASLRLPFAQNISEDEVFYTLVAQRWLAGLPPYAASFDVKPPGLFALLAAAQAIFGTSIFVIKGLEIVCVAATAFGLYMAAARCFSREAGWLAGALYPFYSLALGGVNAPTELVEAPFEVFAVLAVLTSMRQYCRRMPLLMLAGVLMGTAGMVKQTAAFPALALLAALVAQAWMAWPEKFKAAGALGMGVAVAPSGFVLFFLATGKVADLLAGAVFGAAGRLGGDGISFGAGLLRFLPQMKPLLALLIPALLVVTRVAGWRRGPMALGFTVILFWLAGEAAGVIATRSMYDHYFLALEPPLALLAGVFVFHVLKARQWAAPIVVIAFIWPVAVGGLSFDGAIDWKAAEAAARALTTAGVPADAPVLVANRSLLVTLLSKRPPASRYFHPQHLLCDFPAPDADPLAVALAQSPAAIVLADESRGMVCEREDRLAELKAALVKEYCVVAQVGDAAENYAVFVRREAPWAHCGVANEP